MRSIVYPLALALGVFAMGCSKGGGSTSPADAKAVAASPASSPGVSDDEKASYAAGFLLGRNLVPLSLTSSELEAAKRGMADAATGKTAQYELQTYGPRIQSMMQTRGAAKASAEKGKAKAFLDKAAQEPGAEKTASGLVFRTLTPGSGPMPKATSKVKVNYKGTLIDGTEFDNSYKRGEPAEFQVNEVIPCWREGVQKMKVGEKARLVCPSDIAYGDEGRPPTIPGGATLVFEVELLGISK
jgi:FKBP-type peptidyl-prolyl cis-trans isomerase